MSDLGPAELERKAFARCPSLLFVGRLASEHEQHLLIYALKDLANAGIAGQLVLAGDARRAYQQYLTGLVTELDLDQRVNLVIDPDEFTLSRLYLYSQYYLVPSAGSAETAQLRDAVRYGCIPIARGERNYTAFFDAIEAVVRATFAQPAAFRAACEDARRDLAGTRA